jgi:hypothetical protein
MDYGPFLSQSITLPESKDSVKPEGLALRGIVVRLGNPPVASVCFDSGLLSYRCGWGGWLGLYGTPFDGTHRPPEKSRPVVRGEPIFANPARPGWSAGETPDFKDPRASPYAPLPPESARYSGLYVNDQRVVFRYTVAGREVLDMPGLAKPVPTPESPVVISRTLEVSPSPTPLTLCVATATKPGETASLADGVAVIAAPAADGSVTAASLVYSDPSVKLEADAAGGRIVARVPASKEKIIFTAWTVRAARDKVAPALAAPPGEARAPSHFTGGGPARYRDAVVTKGRLGTPDPKSNWPYVVDTVTPPDENPWAAWMRFGGFDFFRDGRAAICTWSGDVWIVGGIDDKLESLTWRRFATGLHQPLGLKIVDDAVYVLGRDQITRLHDLNGDGEADYYENFCNLASITGNFHEFCLDLHTDAEGNFYFAKGAPLLGTQLLDPVGEHNGAMVRVSKDGRKIETVATGLRAPNGSSVGPNGEMTVSDNEGIWTPACRLNWVRPGGFYGLPGTSHRDPPPTDYDRPLCWLPHSKYIPTGDNSSGGQAWSPAGDKWGPLGGRLLHTSYGTCGLFLVGFEAVSGDPRTAVQGGLLRFPLTFDGGIMRARFNPRDGQLYVCGLRGWQTTAARDGCFQRVRFTGGTLRSLTDWKVTAAGLDLTFSCPLEAKSAADPDNYAVQRWDYRWSKEYGSAEYKVSDPKAKGRDEVTVESATLSPDGRTVRLKLADHRPAMQALLRIKVRSADGAEIKQEAYTTIHRVPAAP